MDLEALKRRINEVDAQLFEVGVRALREVGQAQRSENPTLVRTAKMQMNSVLEHARGIYTARLFVALQEQRGDRTEAEDQQNEEGTYKMLDLIESGIQMVRDGFDLED